MRPTALLVRDEHGEIGGGLYGQVFYQWWCIYLLALPAQARGQGLGSRLMQMAEDPAREKANIGLRLDSYEFQAPEFYKKLGDRRQWSAWSAA
jgi:GNAT superfamily N-acetyltransferase